MYEFKIVKIFDTCIYCVMSRWKIFHSNGDVSNAAAKAAAKFRPVRCAQGL
jgi:hypothetical protein